MRVLLLGGSGFIGTALARELIQKGHEVVISSRRPPDAVSSSQEYSKNMDSGTGMAGTKGRETEGPFFIPFPEQRAAGQRRAADGSISRDGGTSPDRGMLRMAQALRENSVGNSGITLPPDDISEARRHVRQSIEEPLGAYRRQDAMVRGLVEAASGGESLPEEFWLHSELMGQKDHRVHELPVAEHLVWDGRQALPLMEALDHVDAVVNLVGEYLGGRWSKEKKRLIMESRIVAGKALTDAVMHRAREGASVPGVVIQVSAVGCYGLWSVWENAPLNDERSPRGAGFLATVTDAWERSVRPLAFMDHRQKWMQGKGLRLCIARLAPVVGEGGFLRHILPAFRAGFGGVPGSGRQPFAWVHIQDVARAFAMMLEREDMDGIYNVCVPDNGTMRDFCENLGWVLHRPVWVPMPELSLHLTMGEVADEMILHGQRVVPRRLLDAGFSFRYPHIAGALESVTGTSAAGKL